MGSTLFLSALFLITVIGFTNCSEKRSVHVDSSRLQHALFGKIKKEQKLPNRQQANQKKAPTNNIDEVIKFVDVTVKPSFHYHNQVPKTSKIKFERLDLPVTVARTHFNTIYTDISQREQEINERTKKNADILLPGDSLFSVLWNLLRQGQIHNTDDEDDFASSQYTKASIKSKMVNGTAVVIASCDVTIDHASMSDTNTVLSIFLDHVSADECAGRTSKKNLANVFICHMDDHEVIQNVFQSKNVHFDFIFIEEMERLTSGLLPQEIEEIGNLLLSVTSTLLFSLNFENEKTLHIFKSSWEKPEDLMDNICARLKDGSCKMEIFIGAVNFWLPLHASLKIYNRSKESGVCEDKGLPLEMLLSYNLTSNSRKSLFHSLLVSGLDISQENELHVNGYGLIKSHCQPRESQPLQSNDLPGTTFETHEESQSSGQSTLASSKSNLNSFDIIDGRPVEEENVLTRGYEELEKGVLKLTSPINSQHLSTKNIEIEKNDLKDTKQMGVIAESVKRDKHASDGRAQERVTDEKLTTTLDRGGKKENRYVIKTIMNSLTKKSDDLSPSQSTSKGDKMMKDDVSNQTLGTNANAVKKSFLDESRYKSILEAVTPDLQEMIKGNKSVSGLISGGCHMTMLSAKLSLNHPGVNLITLDADKHQVCSQKFGAILDSAGISNNFMTRDELSPAVLHQMSHTPQLFDFQILGSEIFSWMPQTGQEAFSDFFARVLTMSKVTFVEVPRWQTLKSTVRLFQSNHPVNQNADSFQDFLSATLSATDFKLFKADDISKKDLSGNGKQMQLWKVELQSFQRKVLTSCNDGTAPLVKLSYTRPVSTVGGYEEGMMSQMHQWEGLNLKVLLSFSISSEHRRSLFEKYLRVPLYEDMCPCRLVWNEGRLQHVQEALAQKVDLLQLQLLTKFIDSQIHQRIFSFIDYNSPDKYIGTNLANKHPHSTFLLPEATKADAERKVVNMEKNGFKHSIVLHLPITQPFSHHLMKSPDILRYQFIDIVNLILSYSNEGKEDVFKKMMSGLLASGLTNFVLVPSSQIVSLAVSTIFPDVIQAQPHLISNAHHFFDNIERDLLMQAADMSGRNIRLHSTLHPSLPLSSSKRVRSPWRLNTVRILRLQQEVDHHFQFELDQHQRKYIQHVERNGPREQPKVFLVREEDDYRINYGNVSAISLIALLRMGMLPSTREKFYSLFLQLPLHEDMAPWNIVFQGGQLAYIDQDTRDTTFDKFVPMVYQIMSVLINYERTVKDFKHCGDRANTQYQIGSVSSCVSSKFQGPCPDSRKPVPCGDMSCQPTYIQCLRVLQDKMRQDTSSTLGQEERKRTLSRRKEWEFDDAGSS